MSDADAVNPKDRLGVLKPPLHLVPPALVLWVSKVFGFSSLKYGAYNWREKKVRLSIYLDAMERHLLALKDGEDVDPESGLPHEAHIAASCAILLDAKQLDCCIDDREWRKGSASGLIRQLTVKANPAPSSSLQWAWFDSFRSGWSSARDARA